MQSLIVWRPAVDTAANHFWGAVHPTQAALELLHTALELQSAADLRATHGQIRLASGDYRVETRGSDVAAVAP
jgi:hypothetical protein